MVSIPDSLVAVLTAELSTTGDTYHLEIPAAYIDESNVAAGDLFRVALFDPGIGSRSGAEDSHFTTSSGDPASDPSSESPAPVAVGDTRFVEIVNTGSQGDGFARLETGYVVFVPGSDIGDRLEITITHVTETVGFGEPV